VAVQGGYCRAVTDVQRLLLDRLEIDDLLVRYATAIDERRWDGLDSVFTDDAVLDYRSAGGIRGSLDEVRDWLSSVLPIFAWTQHLIVNRVVDLCPGADTATARSAFHNPNGAEIDGKPWLFVVGGVYHDRMVHTDSGWRICHRVEETIWWENPLPGLPPTPFSVPDDAFT
jgi:hypothetical protein